MTSQVKGFFWSAGIHGIIIVMVVLAQAFVSIPHKAVVIDFTFAGHQSPAVDTVSREETSARPKTAGVRTVAPRPILAKPERSLPPAETAAGDLEYIDQEFTPADAGNSGESPGIPSGPDLSPGNGKDAGRTVGGPAQGPASPGPTREERHAVYLREHFVYIRDKIVKGILYPEMARKMGWTGQVKIAFIVGEDGCVQDVRVVDSSGFGILDRNAVDTVRRVAPFPRPPVRAEIRMAVHYQLN